MLVVIQSYRKSCMVDMVGKTCLLQFVSSDVSPPYGVSLNNPLLFQWAGAALVLSATWLHDSPCFHLHAVAMHGFNRPVL